MAARLTSRPRASRRAGGTSRGAEDCSGYRDGSRSAVDRVHDGTPDGYISFRGQTAEIGERLRRWRISGSFFAWSAVSFSFSPVPPPSFAFVRVLVVEHEVRIAGLLERALREEGHAVDVAATARRVCGWRRRMRTGPSSWMAVAGPGRIPAVPPVRESGIVGPVLMLDGSGRGRDRVRGLDAGLTTIWSTRSAFRAGRAAAGAGPADDRSRPESWPRVTSAGRRRETGLAGQYRIRLSPKDFSLLELFLRHPGDVLARCRSSRGSGTGPMMAAPTSSTST